MYCSYVKQTESELCSTSFDRLLHQSLAHTFIGQTFLFGFKTKIPTPRTGNDDTAVSLQTVMSCCVESGSHLGSDVGHSQVKSQGQRNSVVAWQITCANTEQQIQPVFQVLQTLVWRYGHPSDLMKYSAEDSVDSLLGYSGTNGLMQSVSSGPFPHVSAEQGTLMLSCDEEMNSCPSVANNKTELPTSSSRSLERLKSEGQSGKLDIPFDKETLTSVLTNNNVPDTVFDSLLLVPLSPRPDLPAFDEEEIAGEADKLSDLVSEETLDIGEKFQHSNGCNAEVGLGQKSSTESPDIDPSYRFSLDPDTVNKHGVYAAAECRSDLDETLDLPSDSRVLFPEIENMTPNTERGMQSSTEVTGFGETDETDNPAQHQQVVCELQSSHHLATGCGAKSYLQCDESLSDLDDCEVSDLILAISISNTVPKTNQGLSFRHTVSGEMMAHNAPHTAKEVCDAEVSCARDVEIRVRSTEAAEPVDEWSQMPESEDLSAFLEEVEAQLRKCTADVQTGFTHQRYPVKTESVRQQLWQQPSIVSLCLPEDGACRQQSLLCQQSEPHCSVLTAMCSTNRQENHLQTIPAGPTSIHGAQDNVASASHDRHSPLKMGRVAEQFKNDFLEYEGLETYLQKMSVASEKVTKDSDVLNSSTVAHNAEVHHTRGNNSRVDRYDAHKVEHSVDINTDIDIAPFIQKGGQPLMDVHSPVTSSPDTKPPEESCQVKYALYADDMDDASPGNPCSLQSALCATAAEGNSLFCVQDRPANKWKPTQICCDSPLLSSPSLSRLVTNSICQAPAGQGTPPSQLELSKFMTTGNSTWNPPVLCSFTIQVQH